MTTNNNNIQNERIETFNDIISSDKPVLVDFFATWCGPCKAMHPVLETLKADMGDSIRVIKIDVDENRPVAEAYRIQAVPTLMLFRNGEVQWRESGVIGIDDLKAMINQ